MMKMSRYTLRDIIIDYLSLEQKEATSLYKLDEWVNFCYSMNMCELKDIYTYIDVKVKQYEKYTNKEVDESI